VSGRRAVSRRAKTAHGVRRLWPFVMMAWERWQQLSPDQKERYKRQAREYARRGRDLAARRRGRR
jgi:glycogen debranching enzyme